VIDCTDNFEVRYLVSDVCKEMQLPLIMGAVYEYQAQIFSFTCRKLFGISDFYRDVFPEMPNPNEVPNCNASGVLGMLTGIVGNMMSFECIQYFVSVIQHNKLINYNLKNGEIFNLTIMPRSIK
jgi:adenylyltransferase/sulfurtransferase